MILGILGAGRIATALAEGWARVTPGYRRPALRFYDPVAERATRLAEATGGEALPSPADLVAAADLVIVAVRPEDVEPLLKSMAGLLGERGLVSVAAGVSLSRLGAALPPGAKVGRLMPSVAARLGLSVSLFEPGTLGDLVDPTRAVFEALGSTVEVDEALFDVATAVAGCMPGYAAYLALAFAEAGVHGGLDPRTAELLALSALSSATAAVADSGDPQGVAAEAATPGGMTAAGLQAFAEHDLRGAVLAAVAAAAARAKELA
jgi:pyrroline-5-carboxylate reductase